MESNKKAEAEKILNIMSKSLDTVNADSEAYIKMMQEELSKKKEEDR